MWFEKFNTGQEELGSNPTYSQSLLFIKPGPLVRFTVHVVRPSRTPSRILFTCAVVTDGPVLCRTSVQSL